nr:uncharacterized protein LOC124052418 isoform X2 [Scatophagus argus]
MTCSTSLSDPMGVYLNRGFHGNRDVVYLDLRNGQVSHHTVAPEFVGRIDITPVQQNEKGYGFKWELSLLGLEDTDWYYCSWIHFKSETAEQETRSSKGTLIIVREEYSQEQCNHHSEHLIFFVLSVTAVVFTLSLVIGVLIARCMQFKKNFRPARAVKPPRPNRSQHICHQQRIEHCPYMTTSANAMDFRGIL